MHILVVDDNPDIRMLVSQLLQIEGYAVTMAQDGLEALQLEAQHSPNMIILDVNLPLIDGYEVCRRIKARRSVPILMLTVRAEPDEVVIAKQAGADCHLSKPFEMIDFLESVHTLIKR